MGLSEALGFLQTLIAENLGRAAFAVLAVVFGYVVYLLVAREITALRKRERLDRHVAYALRRVWQFVTIFVVLSAVLAQFGITIGMISGLLTLLGGTVIGFAAINTLGNAIAGLIVMTSGPFRVGDRIFFNGQFADVVGVELIYTKLLTLDDVRVSVPNQELLKGQIDNYGRESAIRRHVTVTPGFEYDSKMVEAALLKAAGQVSRVLSDPQPYVWITKFQNYAVEYTLYVYINDIRGLPEIDAELHRSVLATCQESEIDISTPLLLRRVESQSQR
jgi:small conductance mechanosensitive channel